MSRADLIAVAKAQLWEEAKGKLRAMVAVEGQVSSYDPSHEHRRLRWREAQTAIEDFIGAFENDGLHE